MKFLLVAIVVVVATITTVQGKFNKAESLKLLKKCAKETGAKENPEEILDKQLIPTSKAGQCMFACVLKEKKLMKNGKVDGNAVKEYFVKTYSDEPEQLKKALAALQKCRTLDVSKMNECQEAAAYAECGHKEGFKLQ